MLTALRASSPLHLGTAALVAALLAALPLASAGGPLVDATAVPFDDVSAFTDYGAFAAGVDLTWDDGFVLTLVAPGEGALGDAGFAAFGDLPTDAHGDVLTSEAIRRTGLVESYPGGVTFVMTGTSVDAVADAFAGCLASLGFTLDREEGARAFSFSRDGESYRAVFGGAADGVRVYLGS